MPSQTACFILLWCSTSWSLLLPSCNYKSNQIKSNQIKSNQIKSNQIKSNQIKSNQIKSNQIKSNQIKSNQILFHSNNITFFISKQKEKYRYMVVSWHILCRLPVTPKHKLRNDIIILIHIHSFA